MKITQGRWDNRVLYIKDKYFFDEFPEEILDKVKFFLTEKERITLRAQQNLYWDDKTYIDIEENHPAYEYLKQLIGEKSYKVTPKMRRMCFLIHNWASSTSDGCMGKEYESEEDISDSSDEYILIKELCEL